MQTVVETPPFHRVIARLLSDEEQEKLKDMLARNPELGDVMPGTGGYRKVRFAREGMGKRGGIRVIYIMRGSDMPVFLITAYSKSSKANLSKAERNQLALRADAIFLQYGSER